MGPLTGCSGVPWVLVTVGHEAVSWEGAVLGARCPARQLLEGPSPHAVGAEGDVTATQWVPLQTGGWLLTSVCCRAPAAQPGLC